MCDQQKSQKCTRFFQSSQFAANKNRFVKNYKAKQSERRKIIETQSEATRFASLRFVALEKFALRIYMPGLEKSILSFLFSILVLNFVLSIKFDPYLLLFI